MLGLGSGGGPNGPFTAEHRAAGIPLLPHLAQRHDRLMECIELMDRMWADDRDEKYRGFPKPRSVPPRIVGLNSERLAVLAGIRADGVNVRARADTSRALLDMAKTAAANRPFTLTVFFPFDDEFLDPDHELRVRYADVDRLIFVALNPTEPSGIARGARRLGIA
jgi:alkanesulfonate monooxygenase SsuD/methylene tetrahydromethanopterin reductase-like flavin-dependent oxidoreductase (luciferase family)